jgi:hypothetical protein
VLDEPMAGVRSIAGLAFTSQAGLVSATGTGASAKSSGEHEISLASPAGAVVRGRVCETAEVAQMVRTKQAVRTRANGLRSTINGETAFSYRISTFVSYVRRAPLKDSGILTAAMGRFNKQCDCFVTKRRAGTCCDLKEFTK